MRLGETRRARNEKKIKKTVVKNEHQGKQNRKYDYAATGVVKTLEIGDVAKQDGR